MINLTELSKGAMTANALSNLILVNPQENIGYQPQAPSGGLIETVRSLPKFLFHYEGEQTVTLESDITDHYVEDNTSINDQIALRPEMVTTHGFIGELNDVAPFFLEDAKTIASKLGAISDYTPQLSTTAIKAYNAAFKVYQAAELAKTTAVSAWSLVTGTGGLSVIDSNGIETKSAQNKQQQAFQQFYGYWKNRTLFTVQTPWAIFKNMAIKSLRAVQDSETNTITDFEITFKVIRFAEEILKSEDLAYNKDMQGRAGLQGAGVTDLGTSTPTLDVSLASKLA